MTRHPGRYLGPGVPVGGDVTDPSSLSRALDGQDAAYYLVHSLDRSDFVERDRQGAVVFARAATAASVGQVIYLGGLGANNDDLSAHLRSRREVESVLSEGVPTTILRAAIVVGDGSISWEIVCQLVERLPVMVAPRWVETRVCPVALSDAVFYLTAVLGMDEAVGDRFDIGVQVPLTYRGMMRQVAQLTGRHRVILPVPVLSPGLSSHWLRLITDVDLATARTLVDSMVNDVVVSDRRIQTLTGHVPMSFREAAASALADRVRRLGSPQPDDGPG